MATQYDFKKPAQSKGQIIKVWCPVCWMDRIITTNNKCRVCGSRLIKPKHWETTIKKLEVININKKQFTPVEILGKLYFVPDSILDNFSEIQKDDWKEKVILIERIKNECSSVKI